MGSPSQEEFKRCGTWGHGIVVALLHLYQAFCFIYSFGESANLMQRAPGTSFLRRVCTWCDDPLDLLNWAGQRLGLPAG